MTPAVSIIIPIYNVEAYLRACLDSVLAQSFTDWECIMIDDASTDASPAIAREYLSDPRFRLRCLEHNSGQSAARNAGLDMASGRYIAFVDADDRARPYFLETLFSHSGADIIAGQIKDDCGNGFTVISGREACLKSLYQSRHTPRVDCSPCGKLFKRELLENTRFREGTIYEDLELITILLDRATSVAVTGRKVYDYTINPSSTTNSFSRKRLDVLEVTKRLEEHFADDPELARAARDRRFAANFNMFLLLSQNDMGDGPDADRCWATIKQLRRESLFNPRVRLKNKLGAALSYLGRRAVTLFA